MLEILTCEASKGYKNKNLRQTDQKQWINMHKWRGFIMNADFMFTCILSCMSILIHQQSRTIFQIQKKTDHLSNDKVKYLAKILCSLRNNGLLILI